ncbi:MAG TPA: glycosyltransferase, partial [Gemmatimonadaceae bacterium]|nr:glycosyltransferase [Gemmatimonadaceae bacterium]
MRVIFAGGGTGGHLYPGLAIARALVRVRADVEPLFVGARRGVERDVLPTTEFAHVLLDLHPLYRPRVWENWKTLRGALQAWGRLANLAAQDPPRLVVGTGGYASGLALAFARRHGIAYVLQEQNGFPGLTMRLFARWAREVYLGFPEAARDLRRGAHTAIIDTGNPIEPPPVPRPNREQARGAWGFPAHAGGPVLLVFGGSQGARAINESVAAWIESDRLPEALHVIWATGKRAYDRFVRLESARVRVRPYIAPLRDAYAASDLALARAGAMSTAELCAWGIPAVLVPLPTAAADHQTINARALQAAGAAIALPQAELTATRLDAIVRQL